MGRFGYSQLEYGEIRPKLQTGDILLFEGRGFVSWLIKRATRLRFSHCAMVYVLGGDVYCWESTMLTGKNGVQISLLSQRLGNYKGRVYVRFLHVERTQEMLEALGEFRHEVKGRRYEIDMIELAGAAMPWRNKENLKSIFCSELIAAAFQRMDLFGTLKPSNEYYPGDLATCQTKRGFLGEIFELIA